MATSLFKGIFWLIDGELFCIKTDCDENGISPHEVAYSSKSGDNFNHAVEWSKLSRKITHGNPYNYYPRGRVEIKNGRVTVYLNPTLSTDETTQKIRTEFGLSDIKTVFKSDGSVHYRAVGEK